MRDHVRWTSYVSCRVQCPKRRLEKFRVGLVREIGKREFEMTEQYPV
jgi:hypothetical protein